MSFFSSRCAFGHVLGMIAGRRIDDLGGRAQCIEHRAGAAPAAADQADLDLGVGPGCVYGAGQRKLAGGRSAGQRQRRLLDESSS